MTVDPLRELEALAQQDILNDPKLMNLLEPHIKDSRSFVKECLRKKQTRHMLLLTQWYADIADDVRIAHDQDPLRIIFLFSLAEGVAKQREKNANDDSRSSEYCLKFFQHISQSDKDTLETKVRGVYSKPGSDQLHLRTILNVLYNVRSDAVHGRRFWEFSLSKKSDGKYPRMVYGPVGKPNRKRKAVLNISLTFSELRNIFVRTAIANIGAVLNRKC